MVNGMTLGRVARGVGARYRTRRGRGTTNFQSSYADALALGCDETDLGKVFFSHDGSHIAKHQRASLTTFFPLLTNGGVYAVEDLHTSYWRSFGGGYRYGAGFIKVVKQLIDDMHGWYHGRGDRGGLEAATQVPKITIYDSLVFIHKAARQRPANVRFGQKSF